MGSPETGLQHEYFRGGRHCVVLYIKVKSTHHCRHQSRNRPEKAHRVKALWLTASFDTDGEVSKVAMTSLTFAALLALTLTNAALADPARCTTREDAQAKCWVTTCTVGTILRYGV